VAGEYRYGVQSFVRSLCLGPTHALSLSSEVPETARARAVHAVFKLLPIAHRSLLQRLIKFLTRVVEHSSKNLMHADNLAIVFAPTILQYEEHIDPLKALEDQSSAQALVSLMISHYDEIFEVCWAPASPASMCSSVSHV